jgi:antitoxin (DNA-binding transcriptional repressor) of toxin-antitoxin stability system
VSARVAALLLAAALPALASAGGGEGCRARLSGAVKGSFRCVAAVVLGEDGVPVFTISPAEKVPGVDSCVPAAFQLPAPLGPGTFTLASLGMGRAVVAAEGGTLYTATKTTSTRGEVSLTLRSVKAGTGAGGTHTVRGTYRARLVPAASPKQDEVVVEVTF